MAVDERDRHRFYNKAVEVVGEREAGILMAHLPPGGWSNPATRQDLLEAERRIVAELKSYTLRTILAANLSMALAFAGIAFTATGLS